MAKIRSCFLSELAPSMSRERARAASSATFRCFSSGMEAVAGAAASVDMEPSVR